jgi:hypothetical protein
VLLHPQEKGDPGTLLQLVPHLLLLSVLLRPVAFLPILERVLYRAVVGVIGDELPESHRIGDKWATAVNGPLSVDNATHVVVTDLLNFYSSIPTERLTAELIQRTGRWEPNDWLKSFWVSIAGGNNGIPQVSESSDLIANAYADELHRRLLRRNVKCWRYVDDFRMAASSLSVAFGCLEVFDEEARALGLTVNERKTQTLTLERYRARLDAPNKRVQSIKIP